MEKPENPAWSVPVAVENVPESGLHLEIEAPEPARAALAKLAGLRALPRFSAVFDLTRRGAGVHVAGQISATLGQTCVVTLEPMESEVEEAVDMSFSPAAPTASSAAEGHHAHPDEEEPPEPLVGGRVDLGALATEFLLLGIEPYPRKPDVEFVGPKVEEGGDHPFAALETLKKRLGGGQS